MTDKNTYYANEIPDEILQKAVFYQILQNDIQGPKYTLIWKLEQSDSIKGPRIIPCCKKVISSRLATIFITVHLTKLIFGHEQ